jgi:hypothetical protein
MDDPEIEQLRESLGGWALADVRRAYEGGANVGSFLLAAHLIDALAGLTYSEPWDRTPGVAAWQEFCHRFLPAYEPFAGQLYTGFRSALSHGYSLVGFNLMSQEVNRDRHLTIGEDRRRILHLESFIEDIEAAFATLSAALSTDDGLRRAVVPRIAARPLMGLVSLGSAAGSGASFASGPASAPAFLTLREPRLPEAWGGEPPKMSIPKKRRPKKTKKKHGRPR